MKTPGHKLYLSLSFFLPFTIMGFAFAFHGVFPFGSKMIVKGDLFFQDYTFLSSLWHKLREGSLSSWSWTAGGNDYAALIAYYLASPLNLLALLAPHAWLSEVMTFILLVKIGFTGLFCGMFLRITFKQNGIELIIISSLFTLCAFTLGYYIRILWFDSIALMPLVVLGFLTLMKEGKWRDPGSGRYLYHSRLYIWSLALAVFTNFYIAIFICFFVAITFFGYCFIRKINLREFIRKLSLAAVCSVLAIGMAAVILLPSLSAMQNTYSALKVFPTKLFLYHSFFDIFGNFIAFTPPTFYEGLPNLYSGIISILLAGLFFYSKKISRREKIFFGGLLIFLLLCTNINTLSYIVHGFRYPIRLPSRFSFLISFILAVMAYRGYLSVKSHNQTNLGRREMLAMSISALVFLLSAIFGSQKTSAILGSAVLCVLYLFLLYFIYKPIYTGKTVQYILKMMFFLAFVTELSISSWIGVDTNKTISRKEYKEEYEQINSLLNKRDSWSALQPFRTDIEYGSSYNDPSLYNYNGLSFFSSLGNESVFRFMRGIGLHISPAFNSIWYGDTTPFANAFLNMRYMIISKSRPENTLAYWDRISESEDYILMENKRYLPLGFMVNDRVASFKHDDNPFLSINDLFRRATGLSGDLFTRSDMTLVSSYDYYGLMRINYKIPAEGMLYAVCVMNEDNKNIEIRINDIFFRKININLHDVPFIFPIGYFSKNDVISLITERDALLVLSHFDSELFEQGYSLLTRQPLILTKFSNTEVIGNVTVEKDGILYTSIPADKNWIVYVNGIKDEIILIDDAMAAVRLNKGTYQIEFRYFNKSLMAGIMISLFSLTIFLTLLIMNSGGKNGKPKKTRL